METSSFPFSPRSWWSFRGSNRRRSLSRGDIRPLRWGGWKLGAGDALERHRARGEARFGLGQGERGEERRGRRGERLHLLHLLHFHLNPLHSRHSCILVPHWTWTLLQLCPIDNCSITVNVLILLRVGVLRLYVFLVLCLSLSSPVFCVAPPRCYLISYRWAAPGCRDSLRLHQGRKASNVEECWSCCLSAMGGPVRRTAFHHWPKSPIANTGAEDLYAHWLET